MYICLKISILPMFVFLFEKVILPMLVNDCES